MSSVSFTWKHRPLVMKGIGAKLAPAIARGLNRTVTSERAKLATDIAAEASLKPTIVKSKLSIVKATAARLIAQIVVKRVAIPLIAFKAKGPVPSRGRGRGVTATIFGKVATFPHAFIANVRGPLPSGVVSPGHRGVFERKGSKRLPIRQKYGPPLDALFTKHVEASSDRRDTTTDKNVSHEIDFILSRMETK